MAGDGLPGDGLPGDELPGDELPDDGMPDDEYQLDLDRHSSADLDAAIRQAVQAVERDEADEADEGGAAEGAQEAAAEDEPAPRAEEQPAANGEADDLRRRLVRTLADFDNYRKRTEREKETLRRMGTFEVFRDILGVIDNLERALESSGNVEDLKQGLGMIVRQQQEFLRRHGVSKVEALDQIFDPTVHEAVLVQEKAGIEKPTVIDELQPGYLFHDRLLRPAMVHVAMPAPAAAATATATEDEAPAASEETAEEGEKGAAAAANESEQRAGVRPGGVNIDN